jgi:hypothetical protein
MPANNTRQCLLCFILILLSSLRISAQQGNPMFYKEIQLEHKKNYTLQSLTREIQRQTGISFSYNAARIDPHTKIRVSDKLTVEQVLSSIRRKTGIGYKVISNAHIIYTEPLNKKRSKVKGKKRELHKQDTRQPADYYDNIALRPIGRDSVIGQQIIIVGDSSVAGYYFSGSGGSGASYAGDAQIKYPVLFDETDDEEIDEYQDEPGYYTSKGSVKGESEALNYLKRSAFVAAGISADEVYYFDPTFRAGFDFLYGTVSYNTGTYPHWRYGIGSSARLNDNWRLHLNINTGQNIAERYSIQNFDTIPPSQPDTTEDPIIIETNTPLLVRSKLTRFTLSAEWNMGRGFMLSAGVTLNHLKTNYSSNGNPVTLSNLLPIGYDADQKYQTIDPPYLLGNTYSGNQSSNVKVWLGLQLMLIYRLKFFD